jgi:polyhydroxyalkanoate synthase
MVDTLGNIPGDFLNLEFLMLKPFQLGVQKYIDLLNNIDCESKLINFLRMEKWIFDSPDQAGEAYRQFMKDFYQGNKLIQSQIEIGNKRVDLGNIRIPILNQYGSVKGYAVLKTINTGGFIMIPVPLCLTCLDRNFETGFLTTLGLFL